MRALAPESLQAITKVKMEEARRAVEEARLNAEAEKKAVENLINLDDTSAYPVVSKESENQNPAEKPAPIHTLSSAKSGEISEKKENPIEEILENLPDSEIAGLCEKYTRNDRRWKRDRQIAELLAVEISLEQIYGGD